MEQRRTRRPEQRVDDEVFSINSGVRSRVRLTRLSGSLLVHSLLVLLPGSHHCPVTPPACLTPTLNSIKVEQRKRAKQSLQTSYGIKLNLGLNVILFFFSCLCYRLVLFFLEPAKNPLSTPPYNVISNRSIVVSWHFL